MIQTEPGCSHLQIPHSPFLSIICAFWKLLLLLTLCIFLIFTDVRVWFFLFCFKIFENFTLAYCILTILPSLPQFQPNSKAVCLSSFPEDGLSWVSMCPIFWSLSSTSIGAILLSDFQMGHGLPSTRSPASPVSYKHLRAHETRHHRESRMRL